MLEDNGVSLDTRMYKPVIKTLVALAVAFLPWFVTDVKACSCMPLPTPYRAYREAGVVLIGKVISSKDELYEEVVGKKKFTVYERHFLLEVKETLKGSKTADVKINAGRINSSCYSGFTVGETYLVYANRDSTGELEAGFCSRTNQINWPFDHLHYLRALIQGDPAPR